MHRVTAEDYIDWATPNPGLLSGYATSLEEHEAVVAFVQNERRQFLIDSFRGRILELSGVQPPVEERENPTLHDIPLKSMLNYDQLYWLIEEDRLRKDWWGSKLEKYRMWRVMAEFQATLTGHTPLASKYSEYIHETNPDKREAEYQRALASSEELAATGFPVRVNMNGVDYIQQGSIDLATVQTWLDTRGSANYPPVYHTPQGFWPDVIAAKEQRDQDRGYANYGDTVSELADGVYLAPYFPDELVKSDTYITFDDIARIHIQRGDSARNAKRVFKALLDASTQDEGVRKQLLASPNSSAQHTYARSGVPFIHRDVLSDLYEGVGYGRYATTKLLKTAAWVMDYYFASGSSLADDERYEEMVFGPR